MSGINRNGTEGKQSPRWAVWNRFLIPCQNGEQYLARLRLVDTPWFGIYLHDIYEPDDGRDPHNHPYAFISVILRGWYDERVHPEPAGHRNMSSLKFRKRFSVHRMDKKAAHQIIRCAPRLKTLIIRGKRSPDGWGFYTMSGYVPWQEYKA